MVVDNKKILWAINGGLGDSIKGYWGSQHVGRIKAWKDGNPDGTCKVVVCSHNPQTAQFLKFVPWIDEIEVHPALHRPPKSKWTPLERIMERFGKGYTAMQAYKPLMEYDYETPEVYLAGDAEIQKVKEVQDRGPYVVMHPFAGGVVRQIPYVDHYKAMAKMITRELGLNVVVVGGTYKRETEVDTRKEVERFVMPSAGENIINLVNRSNARMVTKLTREAQGFIGTWSCFLCAILKEPIPTVTYLPKNRPALTRGGTYRNLLDTTKVIFLTRKTNMSELKRESVDWLKQYIKDK